MCTFIRCGTIKLEIKKYLVVIIVSIPDIQRKVTQIVEKKVKMSTILHLAILGTFMNGLYGLHIL